MTAVEAKAKAAASKLKSGRQEHSDDSASASGDSGQIRRRPWPVRRRARAPFETEAQHGATDSDASVASQDGARTLGAVAGGMEADTPAWRLFR
jgi:hypothetical protein